MTSTKGKETINSGWVSSGIKAAIHLGLQKLPSIDPFEELDLMINDTQDIVRANQLRMTAIACLTSEELSVLGVNNNNNNNNGWRPQKRGVLSVCLMIWSEISSLLMFVFFQ